MSCDAYKLNQLYGIPDRTRFFDEANGGRASAIKWGGHYIWKSGSWRDYSEGGAGEMCDASWVNMEDEIAVRELNCFRMRFIEQKLKDSIREFDHQKFLLRQRTLRAKKSGSSPPDKKLETKRLRALKHRCMQWDKSLQEIRQILDPVRVQNEAPLSEAVQEAINKNRQEAGDLLVALNAIEV